MTLRAPRLLTLWAVSCILVAALLAGFCFLDTAFAGQSMSEADPFPYAHADAVRYGPTGFRYFYQGHLLTGPHVGYPVVLLALTVNLGLLWWVRRWGARARRMLRVNVWALGLTLGLGWPLLLGAQQAHNGVLARDSWASLSASPLELQAVACVRRAADGPCLATTASGFPNPVAWGLEQFSEFLHGAEHMPRASILRPAH